MAPPKRPARGCVDEGGWVEMVWWDGQGQTLLDDVIYFVLFAYSSQPSPAKSENECEAVNNKQEKLVYVCTRFCMFYVGGWGCESFRPPNREVVFRVRVRAVRAYVRAKL